MDKRREIDNLTVAFTDNGEGKPIVLLHGWGCNHTTLASVECVALAAGYRVINIDLPGFGESDEPAETWGVEQYTAMLEKFLKAENIKRPAVLGHSFGGRISILYGSRNDVDKIILVDAAGVKPRRPLSYYIKVYGFKLSKWWLRMTLGRGRAAARIEAERARRGSADYASASPRMRQILSRCVNEDLKAVMPQIKAPTLLIWGENDTATPMRDARIMNKLIADSGLVSFRGCGHYSFLDNPGQFAAVLQSFLKS